MAHSPREIRGHARVYRIILRHSVGRNCSLILMVGQEINGGRIKCAAVGNCFSPNAKTVSFRRFLRVRAPTSTINLT